MKCLNIYVQNIQINYKFENNLYLDYKKMYKKIHIVFVDEDGEFIASSGKHIKFVYLDD